MEVTAVSALLVAGCAIPTSSASHAPARTEADHELAFQSDRSAVAGQRHYRDWRWQKMPETQSKERFCNLTLALFWYGGVDTLYSAKSGLEQRMTLLGHIKDFASHRDDRFHGKTVYIVLQTPPDLEWQEQTKIEEEIDSACGQLDVRKNVESKQYQTG